MEARDISNHPRGFTGANLWFQANKAQATHRTKAKNQVGLGTSAFGTNNEMTAIGTAPIATPTKFALTFCI